MRSVVTQMYRTENVYITKGFGDELSQFMLVMRRIVVKENKYLGEECKVGTPPFLPNYRQICEIMSSLINPEHVLSRAFLTIE